MTDTPDPTAAESTQDHTGEKAAPLSDWERKRRLAEIFGDVLPSTTRDERGEGGSAPDESASDAWLRQQVPPHHGG